MFKLFPQVKLFISSVKNLIKILEILIKNTKLSDKDKETVDAELNDIKKKLKEFENE